MTARDRPASFTLQITAPSISRVTSLTGTSPRSRPSGSECRYAHFASRDRYDTAVLARISPALCCRSIESGKASRRRGNVIGGTAGAGETRQAVSPLVNFALIWIAARSAAFLPSFPTPTRLRTRRFSWLISSHHAPFHSRTLTPMCSSFLQWSYHLTSAAPFDLQGQRHSGPEGLSNPLQRR